MKRFVCSLAVLAVAGLLAGPAQAGDAEAAAKARSKAWAEAFNAKKLEAVAAMYAPDGMRMPPNAEAVKGRDAILASLVESRAMMGGVVIDFAGAVVDGALAVSHGTYKIKAPDGSVADHGKWMSVTKEVDGKWTTLSDIWNSDRPLPTQ